MNEDVVAFTKKLREQEGSKIWMVGGAAILDAFMKAQLIDELIITVTPHLLGSGIPLFKDHNPYQDLKLINTQRYGQMVQMHYKVMKEA
ncbi:dihydrofolate reductase [Lysinibacillus sp. RC46]